MIGSSVMIVLKLYNKDKHIMYVINVINICFVSNVINLLFINMLCKKQ
jgi:hypothetical protein